MDKETEKISMMTPKIATSLRFSCDWYIELKPEENDFIYKALLMMLFIMLVGGVYQSWTSSRKARKQADIIQLSQKKLDKAT